MRNILRRVALMLIIMVVLNAIATSCSDSLDGKKKLLNNQDFASYGTISSCGTNLSLGDIEEDSGISRISLIAQACITATIPGAPEPWKALGITIKTPTVGLRTAKENDGTGKRAKLELEGTKIYAVVGDKRNHVANLEEDAAEDAPVKLKDGIDIVLLVDGEPYVSSNEVAKESDDQDVVFIVP